MCECGCGDFRPVVKMPAPDGWYAIEVYPGCEYCGASWALTVAHIKAGATNRGDEMTLDETPEAVFDERMGEWHQPILDANVLRAEFAKSVEADDEIDEDSTAAEIATYAFDDWVNRGGLLDVFRKTLKAAASVETPERTPE